MSFSSVCSASEICFKNIETSFLNYEQAKYSFNSQSTINFSDLETSIIDVSDILATFVESFEVDATTSICDNIITQKITIYRKHYLNSVCVRVIDKIRGGNCNINIPTWIMRGYDTNPDMITETFNNNPTIKQQLKQSYSKIQQNGVHVIYEGGYLIKLKLVDVRVCINKDGTTPDPETPYVPDPTTILVATPDPIIPEFFSETINIDVEEFSTFTEFILHINEDDYNGTDYTSVSVKNNNQDKIFGNLVYSNILYDIEYDTEYEGIKEFLQSLYVRFDDIPTEESVSASMEIVLKGEFKEKTYTINFTINSVMNIQEDTVDLSMNKQLVDTQQVAGGSYNFNINYLSLATLSGELLTAINMYLTTVSKIYVNTLPKNYTLKYNNVVIDKVGYEIPLPNFSYISTEYTPKTSFVDPSQVDTFEVACYKYVSSYGYTTIIKDNIIFNIVGKIVDVAYADVQGPGFSNISFYTRNILPTGEVQTTELDGYIVFNRYPKGELKYSEGNISEITKLPTGGISYRPIYTDTEDSALIQHVVYDYETNTDKRTYYYLYFNLLSKNIEINNVFVYSNSTKTFTEELMMDILYSQEPSIFPRTNTEFYLPNGQPMFTLKDGYLQYTLQKITEDQQTENGRYILEFYTLTKDEFGDKYSKGKFAVSFKVIHRLPTITNPLSGLVTFENDTLEEINYQYSNISSNLIEYTLINNDIKLVDGQDISIEDTFEANTDITFYTTINYANYPVTNLQNMSVSDFRKITHIKAVSNNIKEFLKFILKIDTKRYEIVLKMNVVNIQLKQVGYTPIGSLSEIDLSHITFAENTRCSFYEDNIHTSISLCNANGIEMPLDTLIKVSEQTATNVYVKNSYPYNVDIVIRVDLVDPFGVPYPYKTNYYRHKFMIRSMYNDNIEKICITII